jgi:hypothetical protein
MSDHGEHEETPRRHRAFTPEFKAKIVALRRRGNRLSMTRWFTFDQMLATVTLYRLTEPSPARCAPCADLGPGRRRRPGDERRDSRHPVRGGHNRAPRTRCPPEAKPAIANLRSSTPALGRKPRCQLDWCSGCRPNIVFGVRPDVGRLTKEVRSCARDNLISKDTSSAAA